MKTICYVLGFALLMCTVQTIVNADHMPLTKRITSVPRDIEPPIANISDPENPDINPFCPTCPPAIFSEENPDANACIVQCKADCVNDAAAEYADCLINHPIGYEEICTQLVSSFLSICKDICESDRCGSPV